MVVNLSNVLANEYSWKEYPNIETERDLIDNILIPYGISLESYMQGAAIIQYRATMPATTNVNKLMKLESNMKIALNCDSVQMITKGNQLIIQKPCNHNFVTLREFYSNQFLKAPGLKLIMGTDIEGNHIYTDLAKQPHMLVAGTTGSGKSMFLHQAIISLLMKNADIEIYAIDAKQVEFNAYKAIKNFHYITDEVEAVQTLKRLVDIMEGRYKTFSEKGYRDITQAQQSGLNIKPIVCVIDEFADLIMRPEYSKLIESYIVRLAQKSRAAGIHLIIATQRPTADVITGLIKANIPSRVCLHVNSAMESRIVMDAKGGELLIGNGDMLYKANGSFEPIRLQSCYISADEMRMIGNEIAMYSKQTEPSKAQTTSTPTTAANPTTSDIEESNPYDNEIIKKRRNQYSKKSSWIDRFLNR